MKSFSPSSLGFTLLIGALAGLPPLSIDMGLPGLPEMEASLSATPGQGAMTLSLFFAGFGLAQLVLGPLSDRIGRRPVLLWGMALYTAAGLSCALAASPTMLLVSRFVQGVGAAGGSVLAFAIIRDLFEGQAARTKLSSISMVFSLAPVIAPTLGGFVLLLGGWRTIYLVLTLAGAAMTLTAWLRLAESRKPGPAGGGYGPVLRERRTVGYALVASFNIGAVLAFVTGSPMVLQGAMGLSPQQFGMVFALIASGVVTGAWVNGRLVARAVAPSWAMGFALVATLVAGCAMSALAWVGHLSLVEMTPLLFLATFSRGLLSPNTMHAALEPVPQAAGAASAVIGSLQMLMGALSGLCVGLLFPLLGPAAMSVVMAGFSLAALIAWRVTEYQ